MPKVPHNCFQCSKLGVPEAQSKPCWDADHCHNRRYYQRNKGHISQQRRVKRVGEKNQTPTIAIDHPVTTAVSIIFYRERQDAPVHGIAAEVWRGSDKVLEVQPMHCLGLTPAQVVELMVEILKACSLELGVELGKYTSKIELHPNLCPIRPCPLCHQ